MRDVRLDLSPPPPRRAKRRSIPAAPIIALVAVAVSAAAFLGVVFGSLRDDAEADARPSAAQGLTFWSGGDSTSYYMSVAITQTLTDLGAIPLQVEPEYENGSGLRSVDFFDWQTHLRESVAPQDPDIVVFMIGANDASDGIDLDSYRRQVADIMDTLSESHYVVWIGQPTMADPDRAAHVRELNEVFRSEAEERAWVRYIDAWSATDDNDGNYAQFLADRNGNEQRIREDDGLHFTPEGGALLGRLVLSELFGR